MTLTCTDCTGSGSNVRLRKDGKASFGHFTWGAAVASSDVAYTFSYRQAGESTYIKVACNTTKSLECDFGTDAPASQNFEFVVTATSKGGMTNSNVFKAMHFVDGTAQGTLAVPAIIGSGLTGDNLFASITIQKPTGESVLDYTLFRKLATSTEGYAMVDGGRLNESQDKPQFIHNPGDNNAYKYYLRVARPGVGGATANSAEVTIATTGTRTPKMTPTETPDLLPPTLEVAPQKTLFQIKLTRPSNAAGGNVDYEVWIEGAASPFFTVTSNQMVVDNIIRQESDKSKKFTFVAFAKQGNGKSAPAKKVDQMLLPDGAPPTPTQPGPVGKTVDPVAKTVAINFPQVDDLKYVLKRGDYQCKPIANCHPFVVNTTPIGVAPLGNVIITDMNVPVGMYTYWVYGVNSAGVYGEGKDIDVQMTAVTAAACPDLSIDAAALEEKISVTWSLKNGTKASSDWKYKLVRKEHGAAYGDAITDDVSRYEDTKVDSKVLYTYKVSCSADAGKTWVSYAESKEVSPLPKRTTYDSVWEQLKMVDLPKACQKLRFELSGQVDENLYKSMCNADKIQNSIANATSESGFVSAICPDRVNSCAFDFIERSALAGLLAVTGDDVGRVRAIGWLREAHAQGWYKPFTPTNLTELKDYRNSYICGLYANTIGAEVEFFPADLRSRVCNGADLGTLVDYGSPYSGDFMKAVDAVLWHQGRSRAVNLGYGPNGNFGTSEGDSKNWNKPFWDVKKAIKDIIVASFKPAAAQVSCSDVQAVLHEEQSASNCSCPNNSKPSTANNNAPICLYYTTMPKNGDYGTRNGSTYCHVKADGGRCIVD